MASEYATDYHRGESVSYKTEAKAIEIKLVRYFISEELRDPVGGWDLRKTPWSTVDSKDSQGTVECVGGLAAK